MCRAAWFWLKKWRVAGVFKIVFSSSATVYGDPGKVPYTEDMQPGDTTSPYGTSKSMAERILTDIQKADPRWSVILLRYFNPIGAHESGLIGEQPNGIPTICCLISAKWLQASCRNCQSSVTTTLLPTVRVCATISM